MWTRYNPPREEREPGQYCATDPVRCIGRVPRPCVLDRRAVSARASRCRGAGIGRAWGTDKTQHILWRLEHGELDGVNPRIIVILAGTNNVGTQPGGVGKVAEITRGLAAILETCRQKAPGAAIVLTAIFPRNDNMAALPGINRINANLERMADGRSVRYLSVNDRLAHRDGRLLDGMMNARDKLHPTVKGYQVWADALKPIFTELLGPPAATDHAPAPTGDPGARGRSGWR
jgi:lysophospholipase L1-like esterase